MKTLIGKKIGMIQFYTENGSSLPATVLDISDNYIARDFLVDGKRFVEVGKTRIKHPSKSELGSYKDIGFSPRHKAREELDANDEASVIGKVDSLPISVGDVVSVEGITKGKGFAGVVKRHGFHGGPRTHGQSDRERAPGSIGNRTIPGRVYKGKRMAGHMGVEKKTIKDLKVLNIDLKNNLVVIEGSLMGPKKSYLVIRKS